MKNILTTLASIAIVGSIIVLLFLSQAGQSGPKYVSKGNIEHTPLPLKPLEYKCSECDMDVEDMHHVAQIITQEGITYFFDDIGCVVLWLKSHPIHNFFLYTKTKDTDEWIDAKSGWYSRTDTTPMGYGFGAYQKMDKNRIDYDQMAEYMLQGRHLHDPFVKKSLFHKGDN